MKDLSKTGLLPISTASTNKIQAYLERATRYINRFCRRDFIPWVETRSYPVPFAHLDLAIRRFPTAHLRLDQDLLEALTVNNGYEDLTPVTDYFLLELNINPKNIVAINYPKYWGGPFGSISGLQRYDAPIITVEGIWGYFDYRYPYEAWIDTEETVLAPGLDATQTTFDVEDAEGTDSWGNVRFAKGYMLRIDNEFMEVTNVTTQTAPLLDTITVRRGIRGTTKAVHTTGTEIKRWRVIEDIKEVCLQVAKIWRESDLAAGGRLGVSDVSVGTEISIPEDPLSVMKSYVRSMIWG